MLIRKSGKDDSGEGLAGLDKPFLGSLIARNRLRGPQPHVIEVLAGDSGGWVIAGREPGLRAVRLIQVVRRTWPAHLCRDPTWLECVR